MNCLRKKKYRKLYYIHCTCIAYQKAMSFQKNIRKNEPKKKSLSLPWNYESHLFYCSMLLTCTCWYYSAQISFPKKKREIFAYVEKKKNFMIRKEIFYSMKKKKTKRSKVKSLKSLIPSSGLIKFCFLLCCRTKSTRKP